jgi:hypothetical protein
MSDIRLSALNPARRAEEKLSHMIFGGYALILKAVWVLFFSESKRTILHCAGPSPFTSFRVEVQDETLGIIV